MSRRALLGLVLAAALAAVAGCGRKGPLEPPPKKGEKAKEG